MTSEEMEAVAQRVVAALQTAGFSDVGLVDFEPGESLPIMFNTDEGDFVLELNVA